MEEELFNTEPVVQEELTETDTTEVDTEEIPAEESLDNENSEEDTEDSTENEGKAEEKADTKAETKADKLNPYEEIILAEMKRRAEGNDDDLPDDNLAKGLESKDKNIHECYRYIVAQARKKASGNCAMIEDAVVYGWAHHYYIEPKEVIDAELKPKTAPKTSAPSKAVAKITASAKKAEPAMKGKKKSSDNPLLKSLSKKKGKKAETKEPKATEHKVKRNGKVFTITEFSLF